MSIPFPGIMHPFFKFLPWRSLHQLFHRHLPGVPTAAGTVTNNHISTRTSAASVYSVSTQMVMIPIGDGSLTLQCYQRVLSHRHRRWHHLCLKDILSCAWRMKEIRSRRA